MVADSYERTDAYTWAEKWFATSLKPVTPAMPVFIPFLRVQRILVQALVASKKKIF